MKQGLKMGIRKCSFYLEYVLALLIILECNSVFRAVVPNDTLAGLRYGAIVTVAILLVVYSRESVVYIEEIQRSCLMIAILLIYNVIFLCVNVSKSGNAEMFFFNFIILFPLLIVYFRVQFLRGEPYRLFFSITDIMFWLSIISVIFWGLTAFKDIVYPTGRLNIGWGTYRSIPNYFNVFFRLDNQTEVIAGKEILRNVGIFPESPMFNVSLLISLFTELFLREKGKKVYLLVFAVTIVTSFSTTGIILGVAAFLGSYLYKKRANKKIIISAIGFMSVGGIVVAGVLIHKIQTAYGSVSIRLEDFVVCFKAWNTAKIWGTGFENIDVIVSFMREGRNPGLSNSIGVVMAQGGIWLSALYILPFVKMIFNKKNWPLCFWAAGIFVLYITTIFQYSFMIISVLAVGYAICGKRTEEYVQIKKKNETVSATKYVCIGVLLIDGVMTFFACGLEMALMKLNPQGVFADIAGYLVIIVIMILGIKKIWDSRKEIETRKSEECYKRGVLWGALCGIPLLIMIDIAAFGHTIFQLYRMDLQAGKWKFIVLVFLVFVFLKESIDFFDKPREVKTYKKMGILSCCLIGVLLINSYGKAREYLSDIESGKKYMEIASKGEVSHIWVGDVPFLYQAVFGKGKVSCDDAVSQEKGRHIIIDSVDNERNELIKYGYWVAELGEREYLYVRETSYMKELSAGGICLQDYIETEIEVDLQTLARLNSLDDSESYLVLKGPESMITHGPFLDISSGVYEITYQVKAVTSANDEKELGRIRVARNSGKEILMEKPFYEQEFDEEGNGMIVGGFTLGNSRELETLLFLNEGVGLEVEGIKIRRIGKLQEG